jgi:4-hydroxy-tetrahydrodipicolinate synthase
MSKLTGAGVAIVTPFRSDSSIDFNALERLVEHLISNGIDYLVVMGTTGESVTLNKDEKQAVVDFVIEKNRGRVPLVAGIGGNNTHELISQIKARDFEGIYAILSVAPYYNKPTQEGLYRHYETIASISPVPVILYNVPGRTGVNIAAQTTLKLAKLKNIIAIKEASGNLGQVAEIAKNKPKDFLIISGDDALTIPIASYGGAGVISVLANAFPKEISELVSYTQLGKYEEARKIHFQFTELINLLFVDGNPAGIKFVLHQMNLVANALRLPLTPVLPETEEKIKNFLA